MLILDPSAQYPRENDYNQYLTSNSGYSNAYTAATSTNYFFEVAARPEPDKSKVQPNAEPLSPLHGALDRFAQFFIAPLFLDETLDRELRAVDSENKKNLQSDTWRLMQLGKSLANPKHPYCHFSTGNLQTLRDEPLSRGVRIREEFMRFHKEQYSANRMKLVVLGRESIQQLQEWVEQMFSHVQNKDLPQNRWDGLPLLTDKELRTQVYARPVMDTRSLDITFQYEDEETLYDTQPGRYISHLIGHEGPGSILAYIKAKGWANSLSAGAMPVCPGAALFSITIGLTPDGLKNHQEVTKSVFEYISILHETLPQEWIFRETKEMAEVDFKFKQKSPASSTTSNLSERMQKPLPRDRLVSGERLVRRFDSEAIKKAISYLTADNVRLTLVSQQPLPGEAKKERWYGTDYSVQKIPTKFLDELRKATSNLSGSRPSELHLPHRNEFVPSRLDVERRDVREPAKAPKLIRKGPNVRLWFKKDDQFWVPKANVIVALRNPICNATPYSLVMAQLLTELVQDSLVEYSYDAEIAGLDYDLTAHSAGINIAVGGYNDKLPVLLEKVLITLKNLEIKDDRFEIVKEREVRSYSNFEYINPYQQIGQYTRWLGSERSWIAEYVLEDLKGITADDLRAFRPSILQKLHIEVLAHGNLYREDALKLGDLIERTIRPQTLPTSQWPIRRSIVLPRGCNYLYKRELKDPSNVNHCIEYILQTGHFQDRDQYARLLLFAQMTDEPAFDQLRSKEQLGYVVFSGAVNHLTSSVFHILIQSERTPEYLETRIESFLRLFKQGLLEMSEDQFESHKQSVINRGLEKLKNLNQECSRFVAHISNEYYLFDQVDDDVAHVKPLTKKDIIEFFDKHIDPSSPDRSKLSIHMLAKSSPEEQVKNMSPEEQREAVAAVLCQLFSSQGIEADSEKLTARLNGRNMSEDPTSVADAVAEHLDEDMSIPQPKAKPLVDQINVMIPTVLPQIGIPAVKKTQNEPDGEVDGVVAQPPAQPVTLIEDVHSWKASMQLSSGAKPLRDLADFEDLESKL